jgi:hypothetical protein
VTSGLLLDKVVEESFEQVGTVSTVAVARWMAGEGEAVAREVGQESWRIFAQLASQREAPLNEVTKRCLRWRDSTAEVLSSSASELELEAGVLDYALQHLQRSLDVGDLTGARCDCDLGRGRIFGRRGVVSLNPVGRRRQLFLPVGETAIRQHAENHDNREFPTDREMGRTPQSIQP